MSLVRNLTRSIIRPISEFEPTAFSGNVLWLDASDESTITKDGSNLVTGWNDKTTNGNNATASGAGRPTYNATALNNKPKETK